MNRTEAMALSPLPVLVVSADGVVSDYKPDCDLSVGFALVDETPGETTTVHDRHRAAALWLLTTSGLIEDGNIVEEDVRGEFPIYTAPHLDGLVGTYYEIHTTHASEDGQSSQLILARYDLDAEEHQALELLRAQKFGATSLHMIDMHIPGRFSRFGTLSSAIGDRPADAAWGCLAGPDSTLVFPNGYDARPGSKPGSLYVHGFSSIAQPDDEPQTRTISQSRIDPIYRLG